VGFSAAGAEGEVGVLKLRLLLDGRGDICEALLEFRGGIEGVVVSGMIKLGRQMMGSDKSSFWSNFKMR
jgi:hypothetical protein